MMPTEIEFGMPPCGYVLKAARCDDETVSVQFREFTSTEDGQHFVQRLEGIPDKVIRKLPNPIRPSQVDSLLAIFRRDGKATVYVNEVTKRAQVRASKPMKKGAIVTKSDIVDMDRLELGVEIPDDAGFLFLFSVGWRKGLFYDFGPVGGPVPEQRNYDVAAVLGQAYCHVLFQERFNISDDEWDALFDAKWFPFAGLSCELIDALISHVRSGWHPDEGIDDIFTEIKDRVPLMLDSWRKHSSFTLHIEILECAVERFQNDDFVSCTALLIPRIEGILRSHHTRLAMSKCPSPDSLANTAVTAKIENESCLLLPHRFERYLRDVYFANFNPDASDIDVSRHSVAHGTASSSNFSQKWALLGILVVHQLFYFLESQQSAKGHNEVASQT